MAKRRKRTSRDIPAKGRLREFADDLWALAVKHSWGWKCAVCGSSGKLDAHHLIRRHHEMFRYDVEHNGIALCFTHHRGRVGPNPHQDAAEWLLWLCETHPTIHEWYTETTSNGEMWQFDRTTNAAYYIEHIQRLRQYVTPEEFQDVCGVRFTAWLEM